MKKIRLVEAGAPGFHIFSFVKLPRLGLLIIGTILKKLGHDVKIYCEDIIKINWNDISTADLVGISSITCTSPRAFEIADILRKSGIPVVIGGPHASFMSEEALAHADFVVRGEGEETMPELIQCLDEKEYEGSINKIKGLSYYDNGQMKHNPDRSSVCNLDSLPSPDFSLLAGWDGTIQPIQTSRGCPFDCNMCAVTAMFGKQMRYRSVECVIGDLEKFNARHIFYYDDNFTVNRERTIQLLEAKIKMNWSIPWSAQVRASIGKDKELLKLMKKAGCKMLYIGFESINPDSLKNMSKSQTPKEIIEAVKNIRTQGIKIHGMFVLGFDTDNSSTVKSTIEFALKNKIETTQFLILTPIPGTPVFAQMQRQNRLMKIGWRWYNGHYPVFKTKKITPLSLYIQVTAGMKKFYAFNRVLSMLLKLEFHLAKLRFYAGKLIRQFEKSETTLGFLKTFQSLK